MKKLFSILVISFICFTSSAQVSTGFRIIEQPSENKVDLLYNDQLLTSYLYEDSLKKPVLFPINTVDGITVTRGWPIAPRPGERMDHPHHIGLWMNYESVNGLDFWNNSTDIAPEKRNMYGSIRHDQLLESKAGKDSAVIAVSASWLDPAGKIFIKRIYPLPVYGKG